MKDENWQEAAIATHALGAIAKFAGESFYMSEEHEAMLMEIQRVCAIQYKEFLTRTYRAAIKAL